MSLLSIRNLWDVSGHEVLEVFSLPWSSWGLLMIFWMRSRPFFSCRRVLFIFGQLIPPIAFTAGYGLVCSNLWSLEASSNTQLLGTSPQVKIPTKITGRAYKIQVIIRLKTRK